MQITLTLPDDLAKAIQILPDRDRFVSDILKAALDRRMNNIVPSKWAKIAHRIEVQDEGLGDYTEQYKRDMRE